MKTPKNTFLAWLAGYVDGDGCIGYYKSYKRKDGSHLYTPRLIISQKDPTSLHLIARKLGCGKVCKRGKTPFGGKQMYQLVFGKKDTLAVVKAIRPYLQDKKAKANFVLSVGA